MPRSTIISLGRRRLALFVLAILAPALGLAALGVYMVSQQQSLFNQEIEKERKLLVDEIGERMLLRLEALRLDVERHGAGADSMHAAIVWTGRIVDGGLTFPWDVTEEALRFEQTIGRGPYGREIDAGERMEFVEASPRRAVQHFERAFQLASDDVQSAYALLLWGRAAAKVGLPADTLYLRLLAGPLVYDEFGVPLGLYAAAILARESSYDDAIYRFAERLLGGLPGSSERTLHMLSLIVDELAERRDVGTVRTDIERRHRLIADARRVESVLPSVLARVHLEGPERAPWIAWGASSWVVSIVNAGADSLFVAADAEDILRQVVRPDGFRRAAVESVTISRHADGGDVRVVPSIRGAFLALEPAEDGPIRRAGIARTSLLVLFLVFLIGAAVTGSYLLWRDVKRELAMTEMRSQFVSSVSHELKTPLTAIRMYAETLRLRCPPAELREEYLDTIIHESERLTRLLNNVLDFSKIEQGTKKLHLQSVRLQDVIEGAERAMAYVLDRQGIQLETCVDDSVPPAEADRDAVEQSVLNLLTNAVKYSEPGTCVRLALQQIDHEACISVEDDGIGIAPEDLEHVFDRFYRAPTPENRRIPGTGLGLAVVKEVVEAHGGRVTVESRRGEGTRFNILIPLS